MSVYTERRHILDKYFVPPVSVEKFAAYLDGNLPENEMQHISSIIENNDDMQQIMQINDSVDDTMEVNVFLNIDFSDESPLMDFDLPELNLVDDLFHDIHGTELEGWENYGEVAAFSDDLPEDPTEGVEETYDFSEGCNADL